MPLLSPCTILIIVVVLVLFQIARVKVLSELPPHFTLTRFVTLSIDHRSNYIDNGDGDARSY